MVVVQYLLGDKIKTELTISHPHPPKNQNLKPETTLNIFGGGGGGGAIPTR